MIDTLTFSECDSGFFSTCVIILTHIIKFFNERQQLPSKINTQQMFGHYKLAITDDIYKVCFEETTSIINYNENVTFSKTTFENQFSDYKLLNFDLICPFIHKYYQPNKNILNMKQILMEKYKITSNNDNLCGIFYRGNDKIKETHKPPYDEIINKANELKLKNNDIQFILQTDEREFLTHFLSKFPNTIYFKEIPTINSCMTTVAKEFECNSYKQIFLGFYLASILILSEMKQLITTSGNGEMFICLYRGNANGVYQYLKKNEYIYGAKNIDFDSNNKTVWY
jgi:hypothetical protein